MQSDEQMDPRWTLAIHQWIASDREPVAQLLGDAVPLSAEARRFLVDLALGAVAKPKGRPPEYSGEVERAIVWHVYTEWDRVEAIPLADRKRIGLKTPKEEAISNAAAARASSEDQIRYVVDDVAKAGLTREAWHSMGRPNWRIPDR